jgi:hypothetical protein
MTNQALYKLSELYLGRIRGVDVLQHFVEKLARISFNCTSDALDTSF